MLWLMLLYIAASLCAGLWVATRAPQIATRMVLPLEILATVAFLLQLQLPVGKHGLTWSKCGSKVTVFRSAPPTDIAYCNLRGRTLDESHDLARGNAHCGPAGRADVRAGRTDRREGPVSQLQGRARPVRPPGLHNEGVAGGHPRDPARLPRGCARYVARAEREGALDHRQEKALFSAHRPDRASHQRADPRGSGPREGTDRAPRSGPERDTGRSSLADRTRGEVQGARIGERAARQRRLR